jgi:hypothetical protein
MLHSQRHILAIRTRLALGHAVRPALTTNQNPRRRLLATAHIQGDKEMRALAAATALFLITTPALAASPQVEDAIKLLQGVGSDPGKLDKFCKAMKIVEGLQDRIDRIETQITTALEQVLGANFKAAREAVRKVEDEAEQSPDSKALKAALDELSDKCPD